MRVAVAEVSDQAKTTVRWVAYGAGTKAIRWPNLETRDEDVGLD